MPSGTALTSLTFKSGFKEHIIWNRVCSVQCHLTNNQESPVFEKAGVTFKDLKVVNFPTDTQVRTVYGREGDRDRCVHKIEFLDNEGNSIGEFDPLNAGKGNGQEFNIGENESLIGVYGVKDI